MMIAASTACQKLRIERLSETASVIFSRIALTTTRVMKAKKYASDNVATTSTPNIKLPIAQLRIPKMAAIRSAPPNPFTSNPGRITEVSQTDRVSTSQEMMRCAMRRDLLGMHARVEQTHTHEQPKCNRAGECHRFAGELASHTSLLGEKSAKVVARRRLTRQVPGCRVCFPACGPIIFGFLVLSYS